jgi:hypothetical protein
MKFTALIHLVRNGHRVGEIIEVLVKYGPADWVKGLNLSWIQDRSTSKSRLPATGLFEAC